MFSLYNQSTHVATLLTLLRCVVEKQKLVSAIHAWFYYYMCFFLCAIILTIRPWRDPERGKEKVE